MHRPGRTSASRRREIPPAGRGVASPTVAAPGLCASPPWGVRELDHYRALMANDLAGRRALVTGGASGIGRACAVRLAAAGAEVVVADRDAEAAKAVAELVGGTAVAVDLSDLDAVDALDLDVDILVNNAGLQHVAPLHEFPVDRFSYILRLMLEAPFRLVRGALPHMYEQGWGRIVNVSSDPRAVRLAVQVRLRDGQARARGAVEGHRAGGRARTG